MNSLEINKLRLEELTPEVMKEYLVETLENPGKVKAWSIFLEFLNPEASRTRISEKISHREHCKAWLKSFDKAFSAVNDNLMKTIAEAQMASVVKFLSRIKD